MPTALCCGLMDRQHLFLHLICHFNKDRLEILETAFHCNCLKFNCFYALHQNDIWNLRHQVRQKRISQPREE